ncbi:MAG: hypothetical protein JSW26_05870 [Desulfobacterales bacterium]|nr:MAG: hypothetical protein JSW26_05870 [Desulfobacterales bacterium]
MKNNGEKRSCTMNEFTENRDRKCCQSEIPVSCSYFNSNHYHQAKISSHSSEGLCLDADFYLKPGACIYFRVKGYLKDKTAPKCCRCPAFRSTGLAQVKWCRENSNEGGSLYTAGLKYYQAPY